MTNTSYLAIGTIDDFKKGWASIPFNQTVHYWLEQKPNGRIELSNGGRVRYYRSLCGVESQTSESHGIQPIVPGNFPKCKRCMKKVK